jgi:hypothetical protein
LDSEEFAKGIRLAMAGEGRERVVDTLLRHLVAIIDTKAYEGGVRVRHAIKLKGWIVLVMWINAIDRARVLGFNQ